MAEEKGNEQKGNGFTRELTLTGALAIGLGTMLGAGIFVLSADAAQRAGPGAALSFLIAGLIVLPIAMIVSELATAMPKEGGSYHLISRTLGPLAGAVVGPANWLGLIFASGFYLIGFTQFVTDLLPLPPWLVIVGAGGFFVVLNYRGAKLTGQVQRIVVALLVLLLLGFAVGGFFDIEAEHHEPFLPEGWGGVLAAVGLIIVSFTGFEKISTVAEEIRKPGRNLPRAIIGSVVIATIVYGAVLYVFTGILSHERIPEAETALVEASREVFGAIGGTAMLFGGLLATASSVNAAILASSRINFAMGRDRILPSWFSAIHDKHTTPHRAIVVTGTAAILLALSGQAPRLAEISSALFLISYALLAVGVLIMRRVSPEWYKPDFRVPLYPYLPALGGLAALAVILTMDLVSQLAGLGMVALSLAWYFLWSRKRTEVTGEAGHWLERFHPLEELKATLGMQQEPAQPEHDEVLVAVGSAPARKSLVALATALARAREETSLLLVKVMTVPSELALADAQKRLTLARSDPENLLGQSMEEGKQQGVRVERILKVGRGAAAPIIELAERRASVRLILVGWQGPNLSRSFRTTIDKQLEDGAPCDLAVLRNRGLSKAKRLLVAVADDRHSHLALRLARDLVRGWSADVMPVHVVVPGVEPHMEELEKRMRDLVASELEASDLRLVRARSVVEGLLAEAEHEVDLMIVGSSSTGSLEDRLFGDRADKLANRAPCSVLVVRAREI